jgi:methyl-accepting chemotaxis protein
LTASSLVASVPGYENEIEAKSDPRYVQIKTKLEQLKKQNYLENVYLLSNSGNHERIIILADVKEDFGTDYPFVPQMTQALEENRIVTSDIYVDSYGTHKSIFIPVSNGNKHTLLGIDLDAAVVPQTSKSIFWSTMTISFIVLLLGTALSFLISRIVTRPVHTLMAQTEKVAAGDLREELQMNRTDEIGKLANSFNAMSINLEQLIRRIVDSAQEITGSTKTLYQSAEETSRSSQQVAVSMNEMSEGVNEIVNSVTSSTAATIEIDQELEEVAMEVQQMQEIASDVQQKSDAGRELVDQTLTQMETIRQSMKHSLEAASHLDERSKEIGEIVTIITHIANQTNLLALNASIEAARVGEQGKGFAVVASEIRQLASQSAESALSIEELIKSTQKNSHLVIERISEGDAAVEQGHTLITGTYENFNGIFSGISQFSSRIDELLQTLLTVENSFGKITDAMQQISGITQEQAAAAEEVAASAQQQSGTMDELQGKLGRLTELAGELQQSVTKFQLKGGSSARQ